MQPISLAVPGALAELLRTAPLSPGKARFAWGAAVGPALERVTAVRLDGHTLIVETTSAQWAREVTRLSDVILTRVRKLLGAGAVARLEVRVTPSLDSRTPRPSSTPEP
jgi:hypothetical protein